MEGVLKKIEARFAVQVHMVDHFVVSPVFIGSDSWSTFVRV